MLQDVSVRQEVGDHLLSFCLNFPRVSTVGRRVQVDSSSLRTPHRAELVLVAMATWGEQSCNRGMQTGRRSKRIVWRDLLSHFCNLQWRGCRAPPPKSHRGEIDSREFKRSTALTKRAHAHSALAFIPLFGLVALLCHVCMDFRSFVVSFGLNMANNLENRMEDRNQSEDKCLQVTDLIFCLLISVEWCFWLRHWDTRWSIISAVFWLRRNFQVLITLLVCVELNIAPLQ